MKIDKDHAAAFILHVNESELVAINNALNEVCHALPVDHFQTRMGVTYAEAESLLQMIGQALEPRSHH